MDKKDQTVTNTIKIEYVMPEPHKGMSILWQSV